MQLTIGKLAKAAGVPVSTVRYYERIGLLSPPQRAANGYRSYAQPDLDRLRYIRAALAAGFGLADLGALGTGACREIRATIDERLGAIQARLSELEGARRTLEGLRRLCVESNGSECPVPKSLGPGLR